MTCSMLNSPSISDDYDMDNGVYNSIVLEPIIKHLLNQTSLCCRTAYNNK